MSELTTDPWIEENSLLPADKLHAIGVISFRWNRCEQELFLLLCEVAKLPRRDVWALTHDSGDVSICAKVKTFALFRDYHPDGLTLLNNAIEVYDRCRQNRNAIIHAWTLSTRDDAPLARRSRKPSDPEPIPFPSSLGDLRRVADDLLSLETRLWLLCCLLEENALDRPLTSPGILPPPAFLSDNPPHAPKVRQRPRRSSPP